MSPGAGEPTNRPPSADNSTSSRSLLLRGNAYGLITARSGPALRPEQVELLDPDRVFVTTDADTGALQYRIGATVHPSR